MLCYTALPSSSYLARQPLHATNKLRAITTEVGVEVGTSVGTLADPPEAIEVELALEASELGVWTSKKQSKEKRVRINQREDGGGYD